MSFLERVWVGVKHALLLFCVVMLSLAIYTGINFLLGHNHVLERDNILQGTDDWDKWILVYMALFLIVIGPLMEECLFRFSPIRVTQSFTNNQIVLGIIIGSSSLIFGIMHIYNDIHLDNVSMLSILILIDMTIAGLIFSRAFLKGGLVASFAAHSFYNAIIFFINMLV